MGKRVYIIHGWGGTPDGNWFGWLKGELEKNGFEAYVPQMPNADFPKESEWIAHMKKMIRPDKDAILVGHSLGVIAILKYLETLEKKQIAAAILVAGFAEPLGIPEITSFFDRPVDFSDAKKKARKFIAINSDDDNYVPLPVGERMSKSLGAEFIIMKGAGHIMAPYGKFELPIVLEKIRIIDK